MTHVVTSGSQFLDIDAYGGCVAYTELLQLQGETAVAASSAPLNESITPTVRSWGALLETNYQPAKDDAFTLIDVSNPAFFDPIVDQERVVGVIDHHTGFEAQWQERLGDDSRIDYIGAACTLVYEEWQKAGRFKDMSVLSARLLIAGLLDNTLNFKAGVTTDRDHQAYEQLMTRAELPIDWPAQYFTECQQSIEADLAGALRNDTKIIGGDPNLPGILGQLVIWDGRELLAHRNNEIAEAMSTITTDLRVEGGWGINIVSVDEGNSYFMASDGAVKAKFSDLLGVVFQGGIARADNLLLRKQILKKAEEKASLAKA